ncbi:DUF1127 domain-containing protein [Bradyrhizobium canariense]|uniref:YjiS-like domain-containing protein n=1 Tax=Bradyrhizobium canariense TaxID=255045 RepID=A0A1H2BHY8_9BRAD|nr:DUF1127 domain-containing protein [Bradyrhizobium canariense]SDT57509.1 protein of unknown function [Bradyrhizobium canariense]
MMANHFSGTANDFLRRHYFPDEAGGTADKKSMRTARVDLAGVKSPTVIIAVPDKFPAVIVARTDTNQRKATFWSSVLDYLIESFALYGAATHPAALFALEPTRDEGQIPQPRDIDPSERRGFTSPISPAATRYAASSELDRQSNHVTPAGYVIAFSDDSSRERERKIKTTIAALAELDDRTLLDMGIPHRSQIEQVVRYCHDC